MLASLQDYLQMWQLMLIVPLLAGWLLGGGYLLLWQMRRCPEQRRMELPKCVGAMGLAGLGGSICAGVAYVLVTTLAKNFELDWKWEAMVPSAIVMVAIVFLILYAVFDFSFLRTARLGAIPVAAVVLCVGLVALVAYYPARLDRLQDMSRKRSSVQLGWINDAIGNYERRFNKIPPNLLAMSDTKLITSKYFRCPSVPERKIGYFYFPCATVASGEQTKKLRVCEFSGADNKKIRLILLCNGECVPCDDKEFEALLQLPENARFAERFRIADKEMPSPPPSTEPS